MKKYITVLILLASLLSACNADGGSMTDETDMDFAADISDTVAASDTDDTVDDGVLYSEGDLAFFDIGGEIAVMCRGELSGIYDGYFLLTDSTDCVNPYVLEKTEDGVKIHWLDENGKSDGYATAQTAVQYGDFIVTEERVYDARMKQVIHFPSHSNGFSVGNVAADGEGITVEGRDKNGESVVFHYLTRAMDMDVVSELPIPELTVSDGEIRIFDTRPVWGNDGNAIGVLEIDAPADPQQIGSFGEYVTYNTHTHMFFINEDTVVHISRGDGLQHNVYEDFFTVGYEFYMPYTVYDKNFKRAFDEEFRIFSELSDGNYIAVPMPTALPADGVKYTVYNSEKEIVYSGKDDDSGGIMDVGADYVLRVKDGILLLYTPYGEFMCEFGYISDTMGYHDMLSGVGAKDGVPCYYFIFEDSADRDKEGNTRHIEYYYIPETDEVGYVDGGYSSFAYAKPVLYLYPTEKTEVTVAFEHPERLTTVYPAYNDGWSVSAAPDGTLTDSRGRSYYALYWEETSGAPYYRFDEGFCVAGKDSAAFLEEKLADIGFSEREANEFIIYWLPILEASEYNLVSFELTGEREASNALHITPEPDSMLRMAMHIKAVDTPMHIPEQKLPFFERIGFAAVEWGGCVH